MNYFTQNNINISQRNSTSSDRRSNMNHLKARLTTGMGANRIKSQQNFNNNK